MKCSCIAEKGYIFTIGHSEDGLVYRDLSKWETSSQSEPIDSYELVIENEGNKSVIQAIPNGSIIIPFDKLPLPQGESCNYDGIYTFTVDICQKVLQRTEAILPSLECAYSKLVLKVNKSDKDRNNLIKLFTMIEEVKSASRIGLINQAIDRYKQTIRFVKQLNCGC